MIERWIPGQAAKCCDMSPKKCRARPARRSCGRATTSTSARLPIQTCWPGRCAGRSSPGASSITRGPQKKRQNLGIYRQQVIARNKVIMRWLAHRGGALDFRDHCEREPRRSRSRSRWRSAPTRRRSSARSRRCPTRCPSTSSPGCCAAAAPSWSSAIGSDLRGAGLGRDRARRPYHADPNHPSGYDMRSKGRSATTPATTTSRSSFPVFTRRAHHDAPRPDLPLHLHRQAARRAGGARAWR